MKGLWVVCTATPPCWYSVLGPVKPVSCREVEEEAVAVQQVLSVLQR